MDKSPQVSLGCRMEHNSCPNSKVWIYLLCSTVAKEEEPEGRIHVGAAILHTPFRTASCSSACAPAGRKAELGNPVAQSEWPE